MMNSFLISCIKRKQRNLNVEGQPWLLISDVFKGQQTYAVKEIVKKYRGKMDSVPNKGTSYS